MREARAFGKIWWCHGGGAATSLLLIVASVFRAPRHVLFWAALAFFIAHLAMAIRRYLTERRARTSATVTRHHHARTGGYRINGMVFTPPPANSLLVPIKITGKDLR